MRSSGGRARTTPDAPAVRALRRIATGQSSPRVAPALERILERRPAAPRPGERCEMCGEDIPAEHRHVVNLESRSLMCSCTACFLLFTQEGAAQGKYRAVPDRFLYEPAFAVTDTQWDALQIPVGTAFFFRNSALGRFVAFYPSPGGATESLLDLAAWDEILASHPHFAGPADDVEALIVRRSGDGYECYLVPVDACYELVGLVRVHWTGFDGGSEVREELDRFFARLRDRSRMVER